MGGDIHLECSDIIFGGFIVKTTENKWVKFDHYYYSL